MTESQGSAGAPAAGQEDAERLGGLHGWAQPCSDNSVPRGSWGNTGLHSLSVVVNVILRWGGPMQLL